VVGVIELRAAAMRYSSHGYPVHPLRPRGKVPLTPHGFLDASSDPGQVFEWWRRWPTANIGIPTGPASGLLVVDLDGAEGLASWARLEAEHGWVDTLTVLTGRGRHLWFTWPEGCELGNSSGLLGPHVDTRGIGGYIVAPPSLHPNGQLYRWSSDTRPGPNGAQEPPSWLLEALEPAAPAPRRPRRQGGACVVGVVPSDLPRHLQAQAGEAPNGDRSRQTYRLVCASIEWGLSDSEVHALLAAHQPTVEKYGDRATTQVETIIGRVRGQHRHEGQPCDLAGCPNAPRWMGVSV
jgi:Bifunctional DNA primase/polymerase, N-terminal